MPTGRWHAQYERVSLGYYLRFAEAIETIRSYVFKGQVRPKQQGRCLADDDGRRLIKDAEFSITELKMFYTQSLSPEEIARRFNGQEQSVSKILQSLKL